MLIKQTVEQLLQLVLSRLLPLVLAVGTLVGAYFLCQALEPLGGDLLARTTAQEHPDSPVVLVLIDDESVRQLENRFGPLMWHDEAYLDILNRIQSYNPSVMVLDADVQNIHRLANKPFQLYPSLVIGWDLAALDRITPNTLPWLFSLKAGVVNNEGDATDGIVRHHKRFITTPFGSFPSLSVATAIEYLRVKRGERQAKLLGKKPSIGLNTLPSNPQPSNNQEIALSPPDASAERAWQNTFPEGLLQRKDFLLHWYQTQPTSVQGLRTSHPAIPLWKLYTNQGISPQALQGKVVILGNATSLYRDHRTTPMDIRHLHADVHATAIDNILLSNALERAPQWQQALISLGFFVFVCFVQIRIRHLGINLSLTLGLLALYTAIVVHQFVQQGWILDWITPTVFITLGVLMGSTFRILMNDEQHKAMEYTLSQLVSQSVFQEIQRAGYTLEPGGQKMDITCLFVDIRNFSALAENMPPSAVTELLNEFYTIVEKITFQHRGTVDKFMGDGILILFGAPIPTQTHAQDAILAAQDILLATQSLGKRWWETTGIQVEIGISVNSGPAFVGFLGPIYKLEYTAIGDTVNLCIRLQNENKRFKTRVILSEFTISRLSEAEQQKWQELDRVTVRGREGLVKVYTHSIYKKEGPAGYPHTLGATQAGSMSPQAPANNGNEPPGAGPGLTPGMTPPERTLPATELPTEPPLPAPKGTPTTTEKQAVPQLPPIG